jgi:formylglycine-generating enzyme required for sulfatase activity
MPAEKSNFIQAFLQSISHGFGKRSQVQENETPPLLVPQFEPDRRQNFITLAPGVEIFFVPVPAGKFLMGSDPAQDKSAFVEEQPVHSVHLDVYWIGKYPITNEQYQVFVRATGHRAPVHWKNKVISKGEEQHPVVNVSWQDAIAFCQWVRELPGRRAVRLPTEAEWEKAARGGDGRIYPWGNEAPTSKRCNFELSVSGTSPVGKYSPQGDSPYDCADMAGNVWEWVNDWFDAHYYGIAPASNPRGPSSGSTCVLRGGAFDNNHDYIRCACRNGGNPNYGSNYLGFRVAISSFF